MVSQTFSVYREPNGAVRYTSLSKRKCRMATILMVRIRGSALTGKRRTHRDGLSDRRRPIPAICDLQAGLGCRSDGDPSLQLRWIFSSCEPAAIDVDWSNTFFARSSCSADVTIADVDLI